MTNKKIISDYLKLKYPSYTHMLDLDLAFDTIGGFCIRYLRKEKIVNFKIIDFSKEEKSKIEKFINSYSDEDTNYLKIFYNKSLVVIKILNDYYINNKKMKA